MGDEDLSNKEIDKLLTILLSAFGVVLFLDIFFELPYEPYVMLVVTLLLLNHAKLRTIEEKIKKLKKEV